MAAVTMGTTIPDLYEGLPIAYGIVVFRRTGWAVVLYPALLQLDVLRALMKSADSRLIRLASSRALSGIQIW
jgi:hypothetical protein